MNVQRVAPESDHDSRGLPSGTAESAARAVEALDANDTLLKLCDFLPHGCHESARQALSSEIPLHVLPQPRMNLGIRGACLKRTSTNHVGAAGSLSFSEARAVPRVLTCRQVDFDVSPNDKDPTRAWWIEFSHLFTSEHECPGRANSCCAHTYTHSRIDVPELISDRGKI